MPGYLRVHAPQARNVIGDERAMTYLEPFIARTRTIGDVAQELGTTNNAVYVRVRRFLQLGLLRVVREQRRRGKPVKHYRSAADAFFVPVPPGEMHRITLAHDRSYAERFGEAAITFGFEVGVFKEDMGVLVHRTPKGVERLLHDGTNPTRLDRADIPLVWGWWEINLTPAEARALAEGLRALAAPYLSRPKRKGRPYLLGTFLSPE